MSTYPRAAHGGISVATARGVGYAVSRYGTLNETASADGEPPHKAKRTESVVAPRASSAHTHDRPLML